MTRHQAEALIARLIEGDKELADELISHVSDKTDITEAEMSQQQAESIAGGLINWLVAQAMSADFDEIEFGGVINGRRIPSSFFILVE
jgi:hypothetical protein